jgi:hypothetical protein
VKIQQNPNDCAVFDSLNKFNQTAGKSKEVDLPLPLVYDVVKVRNWRSLRTGKYETVAG